MLNKTIKTGNVIGGVIALLFVGFLVFQMMPDTVRSETVNVTATVGSMYTCTIEDAASAFGTINQTAVFTATTWTTTTITANGAIFLDIYDAGGGGNPGLWSSGQSHLIGSADGDFDNSTTVDSGDESYGIQVSTTTAGTGNTLMLSFRSGTSNQEVDADCSDGSCYIGGLELTGSSYKIASTTAGMTNLKEVEVKYVASASATTKAAADYTDTVTYTCAP